MHCRTFTRYVDHIPCIQQVPVLHEHTDESLRRAYNRIISPSSEYAMSFKAERREAVQKTTPLLTTRTVIRARSLEVGIRNVSQRQVQLSLINNNTIILTVNKKILLKKTLHTQPTNLPKNNHTITTNLSPSPQSSVYIQAHLTTPPPDLPLGQDDPPPPTLRPFRTPLLLTHLHHP